MAYQALPTQEELHQRFNYDPLSGLLTYRGDHYNRPIGKVAGYKSKASKKKAITYLKVRWGKHSEGTLTAFYVNRIVWRWMTGEDPGDFQIDHKNGDGLDHTWSNLRKVSPEENSKMAVWRRMWKKINGSFEA